MRYSLRSLAIFVLLASSVVALISKSRSWIIDCEVIVHEPIELMGGTTSTSPDGRRIALLDSYSNVYIFWRETKSHIQDLDHEFSTFYISFQDDNTIVTLSDIGDDAIKRVWTRQRPEYWWGVLTLPTFWLMTALALALIWSLYRDRISLPPARKKRGQTI